MINFPRQIFWLPSIAITTFFVVLFLYTKFFGGIPFSVTSVTTTKADIFTVQGQGKVTSVPNLAQINLGITVTRPTVFSAQEEANKIINKITQDLKNLGIEEKNIKTVNYNVNPEYDYSGPRQRVTGYRVTASVEVKTKKLEKINEVIDAATAAGANLVGGLSFTFDEEKQKELASQARKKAVGEAKEKAKDLASAAGIKLGRIVNVQEQAAFPWERPIPLALERAAPPEGTQVQPGESEVTITIILSYEIK